jgi:tetratricopeptide (TPR) repeat protein
LKLELRKLKSKFGKRDLMVRLQFSTVSSAVLLLLGVFSCPVNAADLSQAQKLFYQGDYSACIDMCSPEVKSGIWNDGWSRLLIESHFALGQYEQAKEVYEQVQLKFNNSLTLRILGAEAYRYCGESAKGNKLLNDIPDLITTASYRFTDRENRLALGRYALSIGEDARRILKSNYDLVLKSDSRYVEAYLAIAELALEKADYQEAAKTLAKAAELRPEDPKIHFMLAKAWAASEDERAAVHLAKALELNPRHADSLLMQARNRIDGERYDEAQTILTSVLDTNAKHPIALALQAAIAHLSGNYEQEGKLRRQALATWNLNPAVDHTIGEILSRHYRFAEGVEYQRRAFQMDPTFVAARFSLAQDLLRLGKDEEGWELVRQVADQDRYNVEAFNLRTLQDRLDKFTTIEGDGIWIRMDAKEAEIYGRRALRLLQEAKQVLEKKYDFQLQHRVTVEIFPQQSDFAIRTFGLPGGAGFLGVCFGNVITANSPASQGETPSNWESVLWHEFCHSITLQKTNNRMPRWLSEGISVYEELERDSSWGQRMNPTYRQMLLGEDFVPLSQLSNAFLSPPSPKHLQFAYFESSLAVRYLVEVRGLPLLQRLLIDLGLGLPINTALSNRYGTTEVLDEDFKQYVTKLAKEFHVGTDFTPPTKSEGKDEVDWQDWLKQKPNSYLAQRQLVMDHIKSKDWKKAEAAVKRLLELYPDDAESGGALELAALVARENQDTVTEKDYLLQITQLSSDRLPALVRLLEVNRSQKDWTALVESAQRFIAVQPMVATGHEALVEANRNLGKVSETTEPLRAIQQLKPTDPAGIHYQLAQGLVAAGEPAQARLEVLKALEYSPRYREAQKLLIEIRGQLQP